MDGRPAARNFLLLGRGAGEEGVSGDTGTATKTLVVAACTNVTSVCDLKHIALCHRLSNQIQLFFPPKTLRLVGSSNSDDLLIVVREPLKSGLDGTSERKDRKPVLKVVLEFV